MMYASCDSRCFYTVKAPYAEYLGRVLKGELGPDAPKASHGPTLTVQENAVEDQVVAYINGYLFAMA